VAGGEGIVIPVERRPEPPEFDNRVRKPGQRWLEKHPSGKQPSYWRRAARDLRAAFHGLERKAPLLARAIRKAREKPPG
jgi:hypothetical protein